MMLARNCADLSYVLNNTNYKVKRTLLNIQPLQPPGLQGHYITHNSQTASYSGQDHSMVDLLIYIHQMCGYMDKRLNSKLYESI